MRSKRPFIAFAFNTTHDALAAEEALKADRFDVVPIPMPNAYGAKCGIAMRVPPEQADGAEHAIHAAGVNPIARMRITDV
ncbi:MAG: DUF3343 domain-containing protein [Coriobacteriales bacterium]|nr:DUF3343 domain-containing protein [Coriobacteriales bacterium]